METKIMLPKELCDEEAVRFVARRYGTTPEEVLTHYLVQDGIIRMTDVQEAETYDLTPNELALFRDLGVKPSAVEII